MERSEEGMKEAEEGRNEEIREEIKAEWKEVRKERGMQR